MLDHHNFLKPSEKEPVLVDECLNDILQMWSHRLKFSKVTKLILKQRGPPAAGQVFTVRAIHFASFCHSENKGLTLFAKTYGLVYGNKISPDKMLEGIFNNCMVCFWHPLK